MSSKATEHPSKQQRQKKLLARLARVEGQIRAVRKKIEDDEPCEVIAQLLAASRSAMNKAFIEMMTCALEHELQQDKKLTADTRAKIDELTQMLARYG